MDDWKQWHQAQPDLAQADGRLIDVLFEDESVFDQLSVRTAVALSRSRSIVMWREAEPV